MGLPCLHEKVTIPSFFYWAKTNTDPGAKRRGKCVFGAVVGQWRRKLMHRPAGRRKSKLAWVSGEGSYCIDPREEKKQAVER